MNDYFETDPPQEEESVVIPINGILDLHTFQPSEVKNVVLDYLEACLEENLLDVRIIHGKGKGVLRNIVHSVLEKHPDVVCFKHDSLAGSWGATVVQLKKR